MSEEMDLKTEENFGRVQVSNLTQHEVFMRSISIPTLYSSLHQYVVQSLPDSCESRLTNLLFLMLGMCHAHSVQLNPIACHVPLRAKKLSIVKRFERFLDNPAVRVRQWYHPFMQTLLHSAASGGTVHLLMDTPKVAFGFRLVMVSVAYQRRSLPVAWVWVAGSRGHSRTRTQAALLTYVQGVLPSGVRVTLAGDCEFGHPLLLEQLHFWGWTYALRQPGDHLIMSKGTGRWQRIDSLPLDKGQARWLGNVVLTRASAYPTHLVLYWKPGEQKAWYLATNLLDARGALRLYRRRMWIEELFGDLKGHGFDLESSHLRHFLRLSRLTLAVCLVYLWLVAMGEHVLKHGLAGDVDRADRRDLSIFRLGWGFVLRRLVLADPIPIVTISNFCFMSGG
jgi:Transposase DDE domain